MWSVNHIPTGQERPSSFRSVMPSRSSFSSSKGDLESLLPRAQGMWSAPPAQIRADLPQKPAWHQSQSPEAGLSQRCSNVASIFAAPLTSSSSSSSRESSRSRNEEFEDAIRSCASTLAGEEDPLEYDYPLKTPIPNDMAMRLYDSESVRELDLDSKIQAEIMENIMHDDYEDDSEDELEFEMQNYHEEDDHAEHITSSSHAPGPLELQLRALMSKIVHIEQKNPVAFITPEEYQAMQSRLNVLEEEKRAWYFRHEALFALRDEDVENIIKVRHLLATSRQDLAAMTKLRDDDLANLREVRSSLAEATRKLERIESKSQSEKGTPTVTRGRPSSVLIERRDTTDLFAAAKAAALEQRALELEKRNEDLLAQLETAKVAAPSPWASTQHVTRRSQDNIEVLNRDVAHKAWKETVADLDAKLKIKDAEIALLKAGSSAKSTAPAHVPTIPLVPASSTYDWHRMEALHEEHASYREKVGGRMQRLRAEKEGLQEELHRKEDECHALEVRVQSLQRRVQVA